MKTGLLRITSVFILATFVLTPGQGLGADQHSGQPTESAAPTLGTTTRV